MHDSLAAAQSLMTAQRVTKCYDLMDATYCMRGQSRSLGHVPLIDHNPRRGEKLDIERFGDIYGHVLKMTFLTALLSGVKDFSDGMHMLNTAFHFAHTETISRYRRSILGPLWMVLGTAVGVLGLSFVWTTILKQDKAYYVPLLCVGLVVWQYIATSLVEASANFTRNSTTLLNIKTPNWFFTLQMILKGLINFFHSLAIIVIVLIIYPPPLDAQYWMSLLGFTLLFLNLMWVCHILAYLGARFRDVEPMVSTVMPLLFLVTPVIYRSQSFDGLSDLMAINPLAHIMDAIREPLLGHQIALEIYLVIIIITILGWLVALTVTGFARRDLAYWL